MLVLGIFILLYVYIYIIVCVFPLRTHKGLPASFPPGPPRPLRDAVEWEQCQRQAENGENISI